MSLFIPFCLKSYQFHKIFYFKSFYILLLLFRSHLGLDIFRGVDLQLYTIVVLLWFGIIGFHLWFFLVSENFNYLRWKNISQDHWVNIFLLKSLFNNFFSNLDLGRTFQLYFLNFQFIFIYEQFKLYFLDFFFNLSLEIWVRDGH